jgi:hypothetical protein
LFEALTIHRPKVVTYKTHLPGFCLPLHSCVALSEKDFFSLIHKQLKESACDKQGYQPFSKGRQFN